jgi:hypothetical protein
MGEGAFVSDDLGDYTFDNLDDWDKLGSFFDLGGIERMTGQLLGQLDGTKLH